MKKLAKVMNIVLVVAILMLTFSNVVMAGSSTAQTGMNSIFANLQPDYNDDAGISGIGNEIINYISIAAIVIAVIVLTILGVKYMIGSASEKAEYKKTMIPYLVGAVLVFGAGAIAQVVVQVAKNIAPGQ